MQQPETKPANRETTGFRRDLRFAAGVQVLDRLIGSLRRCCQSLPDRRQGRNTQYEMADFGLAAFAVFFMQSPSFLAHQRQLAAGQGSSNCETLFGMSKIPGNGQIRLMLDPIEPARLRPVFADVVAELEQHCSTGIHCLAYSSRKRSPSSARYRSALDPRNNARCSHRERPAKMRTAGRAQGTLHWDSSVVHSR